MTASPIDDWGPFGRPLFADPSAMALSRVGVLDVGSNSVRMVVFDGAARSPAYFFNEKIMCALGEGLSRTGVLNPKGRARALEAIKRFQILSKSLNTGALTAVATAAVREAADGPDFCAEVLEQTGLKLWVIDGREEARLSAQGVLLGWPGSYGLVCDIGGASMELAEIGDDSVGRRVSSELGPLKLMEMKGGKKARKAWIAEQIDAMKSVLGSQRDRLFLVGGSWRAIAKIDMARRNYPLRVLHEYRMSVKDIRATTKFIAEETNEELCDLCNFSQARAALLPTAAEVLRALVKAFKPYDIAVSSYGIREGMLYEQMPPDLRKRDPLIEACRFAESKDARMPGFGRTVFHFIKPIFHGASTERLRLIKAACLLHDVSWRAHPDYRAEVCFDNATRANLGGLKHEERIYLGLALLHRYSNARKGTRFDPLSELINEDDHAEAETLGKALRFAAMLSLDPQKAPGTLKFYPRKKHLELTLDHDTKALFGEVAQTRFDALAQSLCATMRVK